MYTSKLYQRSPIWLQNALISGHASIRAFMREDRQFDLLLQNVLEQQWWTREQLESYFRETASRLLRHAAERVPYYCQLFGRKNLDVESFDLSKDWENIPILNKDDVRSAGNSLLATNARKPLIVGGTSGTTGTPLKLSQDLRAVRRENAFLWRQLLWAGMQKGDRRAWIRGDMVVQADAHAPPFWRMNRADNMMMFSSYHLSEQHAQAYLEALARFDPVLIQAYPSSIGFLAKYLDCTGRQYRGSSIRGIVTSSETLGEEERKVIERVFGCRVFDWYGQFERVAAIGTCEQGRLHLISDYSHVELLPAKGDLYELVGTGYNNWAMPLIRYRTGDLVEPAGPDESCTCGRHFPLIHRVVGRQDDVIKLPDGRSIGRLDHIFKGITGVLEAQIRQEQPDAVHILVVAGDRFDRRELTRNARARLGSSIKIEIETIDKIPRTGNGKHKLVVSTI